MVASLFTIYMMNSDSDDQFDEYVDNLVKEFNDAEEDDNKKFIYKSNRQYKFSHVKKYKLYTRAAITKPDWVNVLNLLVSDFENIENINHSYVLFLEVNSNIFAITGGSGYHLIETKKVFNFGLELLSRIIDQDDNFIRSVTDKFFIGNKIGGFSQYITNVNINSERQFNNMFKEIHSALPKNIIQEKLGIKISINKKDYRFLAKDSIKFGKSIGLNELDTLLLSISNLMNTKATYSILPFYQIDKKNPIINKLDLIIAENLSNYLDNTKYVENVNDFKILPFHEMCEKYYFVPTPGRKQYEEFSDSNELMEHFTNYYDRELSAKDMIAAIKSATLIGKTEEEELYKKKLFNHIDAVITYNESNYWLTEGEWYLFEQNFMNDLNNMFIEKITNNNQLHLTLKSVLNWTNGNEGDYNFSHLNVPNTYVLDRIFVDNIEICDLLIEENEKLYFIHVKDGLDGNIRVLSNQIQHAMQIVSQSFITGKYESLIHYYTSIKRKISDKTNPSNIEKSAKNFIKRFQTEESFLTYLKENRSSITFVFAYRPKDGHDFSQPSTISSTAAKLAMIDLIQAVKDFNFDFNFLKINS